MACAGTDILVGSLWFSPAPALALVARGPQALVFLARDERIQAEGLVLAGWGWTWEQAVYLSQCWVPAWLPFPTPHPHPHSSLSCPRKGQVDTGRHLLRTGVWKALGAPSP